MILNIKQELINQDILINRIESLQAWYVDSLVNLVQGPEFIKSVEKDLKEKWITPERKKALESTLELNKSAVKSHSESVDQQNIVLVEIQKYLIK